MKSKNKSIKPEDRQAFLIERRNRKMARSAHAYVRGNTHKFYEWLTTSRGLAVPQGPPVWICGDCHVSNLGPIANAKGEVAVQIRDLDQTVIGNPAHDLIRLGLSLATAVRGSDLPGVTTAMMLEQLMEGYEQAFSDNKKSHKLHRPESVEMVMAEAKKRKWKHLAREPIEDTKPTIPLGKFFWPISKDEKQEIKNLFAEEATRKLVTSLRERPSDAEVEILDAAYWMKGCSSLGRLRYAVLVAIRNHKDQLCLMDIKEAVQAAAPFNNKADMPRDQGERVVTGARALAPYLGDRMLASRFLGKSVFLRELRPQDMKIEIERLTAEEAMKAAYFLAGVVGKAHGIQMDKKMRDQWKKELHRNRSKTLDAPSWLWSSIVELIVSHEEAYLEHCRRYALREYDV